LRFFITQIAPCHTLEHIQLAYIDIEQNRAGISISSSISYACIGKMFYWWEAIRLNRAKKRSG